MTFDLSSLYEATGQAKLADLPAYERRLRTLVGRGEAVTLTGNAPVWMYLRLAHALHGVARVLYYDSPVTGPVEVFNHDPH